MSASEGPCPSLHFIEELREIRVLRFAAKTPLLQNDNGGRFCLDYAKLSLQ
jgi:hypothetical protein